MGADAFAGLLGARIEVAQHNCVSGFDTLWRVILSGGGALSLEADSLQEGVGVGNLILDSHQAKIMQSLR